MRVYISGRMTGLPEYNYPAFHAAAKAWRDAGWDVANPADNFGGATDRTYREYAEADVATLRGCQAIAMLPGWDVGHSGAVWEHEIAKSILGLFVYDAQFPVLPPAHSLGSQMGAFVDAVFHTAHTPAEPIFAAAVSKGPLHFEWDIEPITITRGGTDNRLARWAHPVPRPRHGDEGFCPQCGRHLRGSVWSGECERCEPSDE